MNGQRDRIIIDTNLWISFLIGKDQTKLDRIFLDKKAILLFSTELIAEFITVAERPKFKKYFSPADINSLLLAMSNNSEVIDIVSSVAICRDAKDNFLLSLAKDGAASFLLSGDKDLLELKVFESTKIITITDYLSIK